MISCALIGSIVAGLRGGSPTFRPIRAAIGLASGFIVFLLVRGGPGVLLRDGTIEVPTFNAYSMAVGSLLVGLFARQAYDLLTAITEDFYERLLNAFPRRAAQEMPAPVRQDAHAPPEGQGTGGTPNA